MLRFDEIRRTAPEGRRIMTLRDLRAAVGRTQVEVAAAAAVEQSEVSRIEARSDCLLSSLQRYVQGAGCELRLVAVLHDGEEVLLTLAAE